MPPKTTCRPRAAAASKESVIEPFAGTLDRQVRCTSTMKQYVERNALSCRIRRLCATEVPLAVSIRVVCRRKMLSNLPTEPRAVELSGASTKLVLLRPLGRLNCSGEEDQSQLRAEPMLCRALRERALEQKQSRNHASYVRSWRSAAMLVPEIIPLDIAAPRYDYRRLYACSPLSELTIISRLAPCLVSLTQSDPQTAASSI